MGFFVAINANISVSVRSHADSLPAHRHGMRRDRIDADQYRVPLY
jgi:hypothetical protein